MVYAWHSLLERENEQTDQTCRSAPGECQIWISAQEYQCLEIDCHEGKRGVTCAWF